MAERVALPFDQAIRLLGNQGVRLQVATGDLGRSVDLAPRVASIAPPGSQVRTWQQLNSGLFFALRLEKSLMFVAVFLIVAVAALALVSDLTLIITSKRREVGILGAMGATPAALQRIFTLLGGLLAGIGVAVGAVVGIGLALVLDHYRLLRIPGGVYFLDYVPFEVRGFDVGVILGATVTVALLGSMYAARRAASLQPVEALRR
jgi:lipoprotein-releasing system permease protein